MLDLEEKLAFLKAASTYADYGQKLECIETHMSWVFLVGQRVFKLKKPVVFPFLDFRTLRAREHFCREEVRLNKRMAPNIYLGLAALQLNQGKFKLVPENHLPAPGETVDWLVMMRRLPVNRMLGELLLTGQVASGDIHSLIGLLADFYRTAALAQLTASDHIGHFRREFGRNREVLLNQRFDLESASPILDHLDDALDRVAPLLAARVSQARIIDGHGDLRPDHVCLLEPPVVIDCLEFSPQLRQVDPFDEIAYLGLVCDAAGSAWIGPMLETGISSALCDQPPKELIHFYTAHRAVLRARLAMAHLLDELPRSPAKWPPLASRYLGRAKTALEALSSGAFRGNHV